MFLHHRALLRSHSCDKGFGGCTWQKTHLGSQASAPSKPAPSPVPNPLGCQSREVFQQGEISQSYEGFRCIGLGTTVLMPSANNGETLWLMVWFWSRRCSHSYWALYFWGNSDVVMVIATLSVWFSSLGEQMHPCGRHETCLASC